MTIIEYMDNLTERREHGDTMRRLTSTESTWLSGMEARFATASPSTLFAWRTVAVEPDLIN